MTASGKLRFNETKFFKRQFDKEWVIADLESGDYFTLEGVGSFIFERSLEGDLPTEIVPKILAAFPKASQKTALKDAEEFLQDLIQKKILIP